MYLQLYIWNLLNTLNLQLAASIKMIVWSKYGANAKGSNTNICL